MNECQRTTMFMCHASQRHQSSSKLGQVSPQYLLVVGGQLSHCHSILLSGMFGRLISQCEILAAQLETSLNIGADG